ncbi:unnamed protein product [Haemonchus placei]|uniref:DUF3408 domain-containing protein n=1 Tax=Haemonchus placei TaxID=6290 RepID=A0A0N4WJG0_HAEPC|nr:unnamed protein product [Haemonchus placei]
MNQASIPTKRPITNGFTAERPDFENELLLKRKTYIFSRCTYENHPVLYVLSKTEPELHKRLDYALQIFSHKLAPEHRFDAMVPSIAKKLVKSVMN